MDDELEPKKDPIDLKTEVGLSRREMLRRSAIVGGALVWSVPAIQSMGMKAAAAQAGPGPVRVSVARATASRSRTTAR